MASSPNRVYGALIRFLRVLVGAFFRRVEVVGLEHIPAEGGGIVVSWHPNGLVDPGLILTNFPRRVIFGARHGLFKWPVLGRLMRTLGTVPIYRAADAKGDSGALRKAANTKSLEALATEVARGSFSALFPEGVSHDYPHLSSLKTGVAWLYYEARRHCPPGSPPPVIIPVGLHYDKKRVFRSRALVWFHSPMVLPAELDVVPGDDEPAEDAKARARALTEAVEHTLTEVVHATDDWRTHNLLHRCRSLVRAERAKRGGARSRKPMLQDKTLGFARVRAAYYAALETAPERVAALRARVERYDEDLRALGIEDHELDASPKSARFGRAAALVGQIVLVFLILPPLLIIGYVINGATAALVLGLAKLGANRRKDVATIKILTGGVLFPLTWAGAAALGVLAHVQLHALFPQIPDRPVLAAISMVVLSVVGGMVALRYLHLARATLAAARVRLTLARRKASIARALVERADLHDRLLVMTEGVDLPGVVSEDGSISRAS